MNPLVNFILNSKKAKKDGKLYLTAQKSVNENKPEADVDTLEKEKFARFRSYEKKGELLMIDYENLHRLDNNVQQKLKELDSVIWNGLFLKLSDFKKSIYSIFDGASDCILVIAHIGNHFELTVCKSTDYNIGGDSRVVCIVTVKDGSVSMS